MMEYCCGQNDCEELNITLMAGSNIIGQHHETGLVRQPVVFNFPIEEGTIIDWNKGDYNPVVGMEMKLRGNRQQGAFQVSYKASHILCTSW